MSDVFNSKQPAWRAIIERPTIGRGALAAAHALRSGHAPLLAYFNGEFTQRLHDQALALGAPPVLAGRAGVVILHATPKEFYAEVTRYDPTHTRMTMHPVVRDSLAGLVEALNAEHKAAPVHYASGLAEVMQQKVAFFGLEKRWADFSQLLTERLQLALSVNRMGETGKSKAQVHFSIAPDGMDAHGHIRMLGRFSFSQIDRQQLAEFDAWFAKLPDVQLQSASSDRRRDYVMSAPTLEALVNTVSARLLEPVRADLGAPYRAEQAKLAKAQARGSGWNKE